MSAAVPRADVTASMLARPPARYCSLPQTYRARPHDTTDAYEHPKALPEAADIVWLQELD